VVSGFGMALIGLSGLGFINALYFLLLLLNKNRSNMEMVQLQWNFLLQEILHIFYTFSLACLADIFLEQSRSDVLYIKEFFYRRSFSSQYLSNEDTITVLMIILLLWSDGTIDLRGATFWKKQLVESSCSNCD
jgi:hypothetical protein